MHLHYNYQHHCRQFKGHFNKTSIMEQTRFNWIIGIIFVVIFVIATILKLFGVLESYQQFVAVLLSAGATYVIVAITMANQSRQQLNLQQALIEKQSEKEENRDKNIRTYEKKLEVYSKFNAMLWTLNDMGNLNDKESFSKVKEMCMKELIFVISDDKIERLRKALDDAKQNYDSQQAVEKSYAEITSILREDLGGSAIKSVDVLRIFNAVRPEPQEDEPEKHEVTGVNIEMPVVGQADATAPMSEPDATWQREETKVLWNQYEADNIKCYHFNAWDVDKQRKALESGNMILSLIEYDENWRTERLRQVQKGDAVFLFNRGGKGYVGLYRATGTVVLRMENRMIDEKTLPAPKERLYIMMSEDGGEEKEITKAEAAKYDIYDAIDDGATFVSAIKVEPVLLRNHSWNPIGTMRQTIVRPSEDNVWQLMKYFDSEDK